MMCVVVLVVMIPVSFTNDMDFKYEVAEGNARFVENIETNLDKNIVKYYTPQHNDVLESYKIQDFERNKQITCLPALKECRIRKINKEEMPGDAGSVTESFIHSWNKGVNSISSENTQVIEEKYYVDGEEVNNTVSLGEDLRKFYEKFGYPLYKEKKIPEDAEILNISYPAGDRTKRAIIPLSIDCKGQNPKLIFGRDAGRSCNYIKLCKEAVGNNVLVAIRDCPNFHITSPLVYTCSCCPWVKKEIVQANGKDCACNRLYSPN